MRGWLKNAVNETGRKMIFNITRFSHDGLFILLLILMVIFGFIIPVSETFHEKGIKDACLADGYVDMKVKSGFGLESTYYCIDAHSVADEVLTRCSWNFDCGIIAKVRSE